MYKLPCSPQRCTTSLPPHHCTTSCLPITVQTIPCLPIHEYKLSLPPHHCTTSLPPHHWYTSLVFPNRCTQLPSLPITVQLLALPITVPTSFSPQRLVPTSFAALPNGWYNNFPPFPSPSLLQLPSLPITVQLPLPPQPASFAVNTSLPPHHCKLFLAPQRCTKLPLPHPTAAKNFPPLPQSLYQLPCLPNRCTTSLPPHHCTTSLAPHHCYTSLLHLIPTIQLPSSPCTVQLPCFPITVQLPCLFNASLCTTPCLIPLVLPNFLALPQPCINFPPPIHCYKILPCSSPTPIVQLPASTHSLYNFQSPPTRTTTLPSPFTVQLALPPPSPVTTSFGPLPTLYNFPPSPFHLYNFHVSPNAVNKNFPPSPSLYNFPASPSLYNPPCCLPITVQNFPPSPPSTVTNFPCLPMPCNKLLCLPIHCTTVQLPCLLKTLLQLPSPPITAYNFLSSPSLFTTFPCLTQRCLPTFLASPSTVQNFLAFPQRCTFSFLASQTLSTSCLPHHCTTFLPSTNTLLQLASLSPSPVTTSLPPHHCTTSLPFPQRCTTSLPPHHCCYNFLALPIHCLIQLPLPPSNCNNFMSPPTAVQLPPASPITFVCNFHVSPNAVITNTFPSSSNITVPTSMFSPNAVYNFPSLSHHLLQLPCLPSHCSTFPASPINMLQLPSPTPITVTTFHVSPQRVLSNFPPFPITVQTFACLPHHCYQLPLPRPSLFTTSLPSPITVPTSMYSPSLIFAGNADVTPLTKTLCLHHCTNFPCLLNAVQLSLPSPSLYNFPCPPQSSCTTFPCLPITVQLPCLSHHLVQLPCLPHHCTNFTTSLPPPTTVQLPCLLITVQLPCLPNTVQLPCLPNAVQLPLPPLYCLKLPWFLPNTVQKFLCSPKHC
ncbi:hypothetical protein C7M84_009385 [Penaeus vannamei]|uniref:Uncharacterized protein n=1 Tax=Penaeus vannamei TaxID=6689 RepID=A0A3R7PNK4_PENVA|nr:hypothetical protein C7M84_009385 [Penaeus vannamei]